MVYEQVTRKFPNLVRSDIGLFTNDEDAVLVADLSASEVDILVDDASRFEPGMWVPVRGVNGLEVCQIVSVSLPLNMVTVTRARDGTVGIPHSSGESLQATVPAKALNQIVEELLYHQAVLRGSAGPTITITTDYVVTQDFLTIFVDCTAGDVTVTLPVIKSPQYITVKKIAGPPSNEIIIVPQPGDLTDGDPETRIRFTNTSVTLTNDDDTNWWLI